MWCIFVVAIGSCHDSILEGWPVVALTTLMILYVAQHQLNSARYSPENAFGLLLCSGYFGIRRDHMSA